MIGLMFLTEHSSLPFELIFIFQCPGLQIFFVKIPPGHDESLADQN